VHHIRPTQTTSCFKIPHLSTASEWPTRYSITIQYSALSVDSGQVNISHVTISVSWLTLEQTLETS